MIEGLSINGLWPAGLPVAVAVVLLTILVARVHRPPTKGGTTQDARRSLATPRSPERSRAAVRG